jgi:hypothetical protein
MKKWGFFLLTKLSVFSFPIFALNIRGIIYNEIKDEIELAFTYSGGFKEHLFKLEFKTIENTFPRQVRAVLKHTCGAHDKGNKILRERFYYSVKHLPKPILLIITNEEETSQQALKIGID